METSHSFGYWVRRRRKALDLTQRELAQRAACSLSAIKKIEADSRRPSRQLAEALAEALAIPEEERESFLLSARGRAPVDRMLLADQPLASAADQFGEASWIASNLPAAPGPLFGREEELDRLAGQLMSDENRLITLVGPGGVGKSHLALEAARRVQEQFRDGAWFVPLAGVHDHAKLSTAVAVALGLNFAGPLDPEEQLVRQLAERRLLLLLDNFEQLLPQGTELISSLVRRGPGIILLVTSRERLRLQAETTIPISGLRHEAARRLFLDRATRSGTHLRPDRAEDTSQAIDGICRLVGGLPLALELAAAWARILSPAEILADLQNNLDLLAGGLRDVPERHRSMQAVFDASWTRLLPDEQALLAGLSVFAGSFTREAAETVCGATLPQLATLHDHSLIERDNERLRLHELIRQMAVAKLAGLPDVEAAVRDRHATCYADFLGRLSGYFKTGDDQLTGWQDGIDREIDNIDVAWWWAIGNDQPQRLLPAVMALWQYLDMRGQMRQGSRMFAALFECATNTRVTGYAEESTLRQIQAVALAARGFFGTHTGRIAEAQERLRQAMSLLNGLRAPDERVAILALLGTTAILTMNNAFYQVIAETLALARHEGHVWGQALALNFLGLFDILKRPGKAKDTLMEAVALWNEHPGLTYCKARSMANLGLAHHALGDYESAQAVQEEALRIAQKVRDYGFVPLTRGYLAFHYYAQGEMAQAKSGFVTSLSEAQRFSLRAFVGHSILGLGLVAAGEGLASRAVTLLTSALGQTGPGRGLLLGEPGRVLGELRAELSPADFAAAEARGQELDTDDLIHLALSEGSRS